MCQVEMDHDLIASRVASQGHPTFVEGCRCPRCNEQFVVVNEEAVPAEEYEALSGAPDSPMTEADVDRMFEEDA